MSDSIPNSPQELFSHLPPEKQLLAACDDQIQLLKLMQQNCSDYEDDDTVEINAAEFKRSLVSWLWAVESLKTWVKTCMKIKQLFSR